MRNGLEGLIDSASIGQNGLVSNPAGKNNGALVVIWRLKFIECYRLMSSGRIGGKYWRG